MTDRIEALDFGYVRKIDVWGSDERVIESARMSTGKSFEGWGPKCRSCGNFSNDEPCPNPAPGRDYVDRGKNGHMMDASGDEKLLAYLWKNAHHTPFEMSGMTIEVQAPIFVFREWMRHRVPFGYNEASARYSPLPDINYVPSVERLMRNAGGPNKQAGTVKGSAELTEESACEFLEDLRVRYQRAEETYQSALKRGVPKELARIVLPVGRYSKMRATSNLRGWLAFLTLRYHKAAQEEIRVYAAAVHSLLSESFPRTLALWDEEHLRG